MLAKSYVYHDRRRAKKDGSYPVKLRITFDSEQRYYSLGLSLTEDEWDKAHQENPRKDNLDHKIFISKVEDKAKKILENLDPFTFEVFEKKFNQTPAKKELFVLIQDYIDKLKSENRLSTAASHHSSLSSFKVFHKENRKSKLLLRDINPEWCNAYEKWKIAKGFAPGTVGVHMRNLRTVINIAIEEGLLPKEHYPFGKRKYEIPASRNIKKALTLNQVKQIIDYTPKTKAEEKARDIWLFSYLANGINMRDIAFLQFRNIGKESLTFIRAKTERSTKKDLKPVVVPILPELRKIIEKWSIYTKEPNDYVFGFIEKNDSPETINARVRQATKTVNKYMKRIGESLEFDLVLTTYVARHTYATILKRSGAPIELISENLGHKDLETTENYLSSFENDIKRSYQENLLKF